MTPEEIYAESFRLIDAEAPPHTFDADEWAVVRRMVHASGDLDLVRSVVFTNDAVAEGVRALREGTRVVADVSMVVAGVSKTNASALGVLVRTWIDDPDVPALAASSGTTRSAAAMRRALAEAGDAVYVVGNAPTALLTLCDAVLDGSVRPRLVVAMPVGFVAVEESKERALALTGVPVITVRGRKGGSAVAAAAVNALLLMARDGSFPETTPVARSAPAVHVTPLVGEGGWTPPGPPTLAVIGMGVDGPAGLGPEALEWVAAARVVAGGRRHLAFFENLPAEKVVIGGGPEQAVRRLKEVYRHKPTVVLASGDPLFFGIGRALLDAFPREDLRFFPHLSSVQLAFARVKEAWDDARVVSLHGRPLGTILPVLEAGEPKIAVLTDPANHPGALAELLIRLGLDGEYEVCVCENLGGSDERVTRGAASEIAGRTFSPLNVVVLLQTRPPARAPLPLVGVPDAAFRHAPGRRGMITKAEVRLIALAYLALGPRDVLWDVGAGSGSVGLEAARLSPRLEVAAVERDNDAYQDILANIRGLGLSNVRAVAGEAPEAFDGLPDPDAVFVGGSGGRLGEILGEALRRLKSGGRVVVNCVTIENMAVAWDVLAARGLGPRASTVQVCHSRPVGSLHRFEPESPVFILRASTP